MAQPPAKKQKTSRSGNSPIVFHKAGHKADLCFYVFNQEFHVNSVMLKMNCGFFRTPGGKKPSSTKPGFTSEWFTRLEDKYFSASSFESWSLSSDHKRRGTDTSKFAGIIVHEQKVFEKFLLAVFGRPYQIDNAAELATLADMARYYNALPTVSPTVYAAVLPSSSFVDSMFKLPCSVLSSAKTLRVPMLFKESLILSLGPWSSPQYRNLSSNLSGIPDSTELFRIADSARSSLCAEIQLVQQDIIGVVATYQNSSSYQSGSSSCSSPGEQMSNAAVKAAKSTGAWTNGRYTYKSIIPAYYLKCMNIPFRPVNMGSDIKDWICPLLANNLPLMRHAVAGSGKFEDYFLCLEISDKSLPWDPNEEEWLI